MEIIESDYYDNERVIEKLEEFKERMLGEIERARIVLQETPMHVQDSAEQWLKQIETALGKHSLSARNHTIDVTICLLANNPDDVA